jgi:type IV pilus assembly protein PilN
MASINLLPWRDERRQERKQEFLVILGGVAAFGAVLLFVADVYFNDQIDAQKSRNAHIDSHIGQLNEQVREIRDMQKKRTQLLDRMKVIQELQGNRPIIVRLLDQLVRTVPDGVFYNSVKSDGRTITIQGIAESNNRVSSLMRQLDASDWFTEPNLDGVTANREFGEQATLFNMTVKLDLPSAGAEGG